MKVRKSGLVDCADGAGCGGGVNPRWLCAFPCDGLTDCSGAGARFVLLELFGLKVWKPGRCALCCGWLAPELNPPGRFAEFALPELLGPKLWKPGRAVFCCGWLPPERTPPGRFAEFALLALFGPKLWRPGRAAFCCGWAVFPPWLRPPWTCSAWGDPPWRAVLKKCWLAAARVGIAPGFTCRSVGRKLSRDGATVCAPVNTLACFNVPGSSLCCCAGTRPRPNWLDGIELIPPRTRVSEKA